MKYKVQKIIDFLTEKLEKIQSQSKNKIIFNVTGTVYELSRYDADIRIEKPNQIEEFENIFLPILDSEKAKKYQENKERAFIVHKKEVDELQELIYAFQNNCFTRRQLLYVLANYSGKLLDNFIEDNNLVIVYDNGFKIAPDSEKYKFKMKFKKMAYLQIEKYDFLGIPDN